MKISVTNLTKFKVIEICTPQGIYKLGTPAIIIDEGSFYRIDSSHIIDKFRIVSMKLDGDKMTIHMKDKDIILIVV